MDSTESIPDQLARPTLLFRVGSASTLYGCDVGAAQEIIPLRPVTRIPGAPVYVRGLINVRGTIVTVIDLASRLDAAAVAGAGTEGSILLVRYGQRLVGLIVGEVMDVRPLAIEPVERAESGSIVAGVGRGDETPVVVLDLGSLIRQVLLS